MALTVLIKHGEGELRLAFDAPRVVIGRGKGCDLQLCDPTVSARHASVRREGGRNLVMDEGSTNGLVVGGVRLGPHAPRAVGEGELVRVGRVWLELSFTASVASTAREVQAVARELAARQLRADGEPWAARIDVVEGADAGTAIELRDDEITIGRGRDCQLALADELVSRRHVTVTREGRGWVVRDLGSKRGAMLDDAPLDMGGTPWRAGMELVVGGSRLRLLDPVAAAFDELCSVPDMKMKAAELDEPPPGVARIVEAPSEEAVAPVDSESPDEPEDLDDEDDVPSKPRRIAAATVDVMVALVALGLLGISALGLAWVLG
jgi:pSer/pThr/pTyr-binding forkhead associated (FHA) protein